MTEAWETQSLVTGQTPGFPQGLHNGGSMDLPTSGLMSVVWETVEPECVLGDETVLMGCQYHRNSGGVLPSATSPGLLSWRMRNVSCCDFCCRNHEPNIHTHVFHVKKSINIH